MPRPIENWAEKQNNAIKPLNQFQFESIVNYIQIKLIVIVIMCLWLNVFVARNEFSIIYFRVLRIAKEIYGLNRVHYAVI